MSFSSSMKGAPKDGTLIELLIEGGDHSIEDAILWRTLGFNNHDNDEEDRWQFAGYCWTHDHFVEGNGTPKKWRYMRDV